MFLSITGMAKIELEKHDDLDFYGLKINSDAEEESLSDLDYESESDVPAPFVDYDIDTMHNIVEKRDYHHWSMATIRNRWRKININDNSARKQISRLAIRAGRNFYFEFTRSDIFCFEKFRTWKKIQEISARSCQLYH